MFRFDDVIMVGAGLKVHCNDALTQVTWVAGRLVVITFIYPIPGVYWISASYDEFV